jgi:hypothetical protein
MGEVLLFTGVRREPMAADDPRGVMKGVACFALAATGLYTVAEIALATGESEAAVRLLAAGAEAARPDGAPQAFEAARASFRAFAADLWAETPALAEHGELLALECALVLLEQDRFQAREIAGALALPLSTVLACRRALNLAAKAGEGA